MREHSRYHFKGIPGTFLADPPGVETVCYEFDTEAEMNESGLLNDKRRTSCFVSSGKFYIAGHFTETPTYQNGLSKTCRYRDNSMNPVCYFGGKAVTQEFWDGDGIRVRIEEA